MMSDGILSFIHCAACVDKRKPSRITAGLTDPLTLRIWCKRCDRLIVDFMLAEPIEPRCDVCGEVIGPNHTH